jgi:hypothetical protein
MAQPSVAKPQGSTALHGSIASLDQKQRRTGCSVREPPALSLSSVKFVLIIVGNQSLDDFEVFLGVSRLHQCGHAREALAVDTHLGVPQARAL